MFIKDNDIIEVKIYYKINKYQCTAYTEKEYSLLALDDESQKKWKCLNLKMRQLTWGFYNSLQEEALISNDSSNVDRQFNFKFYKENKLKKLIKEWDATDEKGQIVPINNKTIEQLIPSIAEAILRSYDSISLIGEEEEKK